jgi:hypothetical protein
MLRLTVEAKDGPPPTEDWSLLDMTAYPWPILARFAKEGACRKALTAKMEASKRYAPPDPRSPHAPRIPLYDANHARTPSLQCRSFLPVAEVPEPQTIVEAPPPAPVAPAVTDPSPMQDEATDAAEVPRRKATFWDDWPGK